MDFELEELELIDGDLEPVFRLMNRFDFPTVTVGPGHMHMNKAFGKLLENINFLTICTSPQYIVFKPAKRSSPTSYALGKPKCYEGRSIIIPTALREKKPIRGTFKVYKFGDGWAIKRYEPMEVSSL